MSNSVSTTRHDNVHTDAARRTIRAAFQTSLPIMVTFIVLGAGFGILMQKHGFGPLWSILSGFVIFSGTVQFVSITFLETGSFVMAGITAFMVAARHIFFSISMIGRYRREGKKKWYLFYALCDETYAMLSKDEVPEGVRGIVATSAGTGTGFVPYDEETAARELGRYRLFVTLFDQLSWVLGSALGGVLGAQLPFDSTGIDFAMTALFTTVFIQQWLDAKSHLPSLVGLLATLGCRILFGRDIFLIPAMIIIIGVLTVTRGKIEPVMSEEVAHD